MKVYFEHIYEHIGYLFYAVATERRKLNPVSFGKLRRVIDLQWSSSTNGQTTESNLLGYLHSGLRNAFDTSMDSVKAFDDFTSYYDIHNVPFSSTLRSKIFNTAKTISSEFSGNGKESEYLKYLESLLAVNPVVHS